MHLRELEYTLPAALHTTAPARSANTIALPLPCAPLLLAHPSPPCGVAEPQRVARAAMTALGGAGRSHVFLPISSLDPPLIMMFLFIFARHADPWNLLPH